MSILEGKTALITGAGDGIGLGIARAFYKEGANIATIGRRAEKINALVAEVEAYGGKAVCVPGDVGKREDVQKIVDAAVNAFGTIDILVNNAMAYNIKLLEEHTDEDIDKVIKSALYGTFYCMQAAFPFLKKKGGKVINVGSYAGIMGLVGHAAYAAAKEGIIGLTRTAAVEWGKYNIQVNAIAPMAVSDAAMTVMAMLPKEEIERTCATIIAGRPGDAEKDIGRTCVYLASPDSDFMTARTLFIDGGQACWR